MQCDAPFADLAPRARQLLQLLQQSDLALGPSLASLNVTHGSSEVSSNITLCVAQNEQKRPLQECALLSPGATGSSSVLGKMIHYMVYARKQNASAPWQQPIQCHSLRANGVLGPQGVLNAECFIMSVRDPAARFESGFRQDLLAPRGGVGHLRLASASRNTPTATDFIHALRNASHPGHVHVMAMYQTSVAFPTYMHVGKCRWGGSLPAGNHFLTSQLDYLRSADCGHTRVHFLCTESLDDDWHALLRTADPTDNYAPDHSQQDASHNHSSVVHARNRIHQIGSKLPLSQLGPEDARFVRECLYPWDYALHRDMCHSDHR